MTATGENLRTFLLADGTVAGLVGTGVYQNVVPEDADLPFVWFARRGIEYLDVLGETESLPMYEYFDVECVDDSVDGTEDLADAVRAALNDHSGTFGDATVQWITVRNQADGYQTKNPDSDEALSISTLDVEIINP